MVESKLVELVVAGSNPVGHPIFFFLFDESSKRPQSTLRNATEDRQTTQKNPDKPVRSLI